MNIFTPSFINPTTQSSPYLEFFDPDELRYRLSIDDAPGLEVRHVVVGQRVVPLSRASHVRGWHPVRRFHDPIAFESRLESTFISGVAEMRELTRIESQPVTVSYRQAGRTYRYTPDFRVQFSVVPQPLRRWGVGCDTFIEVKPLRRAWNERSALHRRFCALRQALGSPVVLVTEADLPQLLSGVAHGH